MRARVILVIEIIDNVAVVVSAFGVTTDCGTCPSAHVRVDCTACRPHDHNGESGIFFFCETLLSGRCDDAREKPVAVETGKPLPRNTRRRRGTYTGVCTSCGRGTRGNPKRRSSERNGGRFFRRFLSVFPCTPPSARTGNRARLPRVFCRPVPRLQPQAENTRRHRENDTCRRPDRLPPLLSAVDDVGELLPNMPPVTSVYIYMYHL